MDYKYVLASGSPRRKQLLGEIIPDFDIIPAKGDEIISSDIPSVVVEDLSDRKAKEIFHKLFRDSKQPLVVIGADTVVSYREKILGKPVDREDAEGMIRSLQGERHQVYTGVTVYYGTEGDQFTFSECTDVDVYPMTDEEVMGYLDTDEPYDKAGAYGIQGIFGRFVKGIDGDYNNVVGLPLARLYRELKKRNLM